MVDFSNDSDAELEAILSDPESDRSEIKETWSGDSRDKGCQSICAFANDLPGHRKSGYLFVGVRDKGGTPTGLPITDELLRQLADVKTDGRTIPLPSLRVERRRLKGHDVAVVQVLPAIAPPVRYNGRIWIRVGPRRGIATAQDERILNDRRRHADTPHDLLPLRAANLDAISRIVFEESYLPNAFAPDVLAANERSYEERLAACRMIVSPDDPVPTVVGMLALGKNPRWWLPSAYAQFLRLDQLCARLDEKLDSHNRTSVDLTSTPTEIRRSTFPKVALEQFTRNAIMHRNYEGTNAPIRITWFNDRVEIHNPGGPYGAVTPETFGKPGVTDYRNQHLAETMKVLGLVQRFGVGIATAQKALAANGNPPAEFHATTSHVSVTIRKAR